MAHEPSVWIVIPAYDEASVIGEVVRRVRRRFADVIVVDDCSSDGTAAAAAAGGALVLRHPINLGQGAALQTGIDHALSRGADRIVTFDADGQHDIGDVPAMLDAMDRTGADVALGSRFLGAARNMKRSRRLLLRGATLFTALTTGLRLTDCHNGLRVLSAEAARRIRLRQDRMAHASEILAQIKAADLAYTEVPVTVTYTAYSYAKGQRMGDALAVLRDLAAARLSA